MPWVATGFALYLATDLYFGRVSAINCLSNQRYLHHYFHVRSIAQCKRYSMQEPKMDSDSPIPQASFAKLKNPPITEQNPRQRRSPTPIANIKSQLGRQSLAARKCAGWERGCRSHLIAAACYSPAPSKARQEPGSASNGTILPGENIPAHTMESNTSPRGTRSLSPISPLSLNLLLPP